MRTGATKIKNGSQLDVRNTNRQNHGSRAGRASPAFTKGSTAGYKRMGIKDVR